MDENREKAIAILAQQLHTAEKLKEVSSGTVVKLAYAMTAVVNRHADLVRTLRARHYAAAMFEPTAEDETPEHHAEVNIKDLAAFVNLDTKLNKLVEEIDRLLKQ